MNTLQRELQVAFSLRTQPLWIRVLKWSLFIAATARYRNRTWFPYAASFALGGGIALHLFYRARTSTADRRCRLCAALAYQQPRTRRPPQLFTVVYRLHGRALLR